MVVMMMMMMIMVLACFSMFYFQYLVRAHSQTHPLFFLDMANSPPLCILPGKKDENIWNEDENR